MRAGLSLVLVILTAAAACGDDLGLPPARSMPLTVMTYNLASSSGGASGEALAAEVAAVAPDLAAVQECVGCDSWLVGDLGAAYGSTAPSVDVAILFRRADWSVVEAGSVLLGRDDDGWGDRVAEWALVSRTHGQEWIYVYSTHFCVTVRRSDDACDVDRQLDYVATLLDAIDRRRYQQAPVIVAGDFNVFDGFEDGAVVRALESGGLEDVFRTAEPDADGTTFVGNSWAPSGRIDYIFATLPVEVLESRIDQLTASDHYPVIATVEF